MLGMNSKFFAFAIIFALSSLGGCGSGLPQAHPFWQENPIDMDVISRVGQIQPTIINSADGRTYIVHSTNYSVKSRNGTDVTISNTKIRTDVDFHSASRYNFDYGFELSNSGISASFHSNTVSDLDNHWIFHWEPEVPLPPPYPRISSGGEIVTIRQIEFDRYERHSLASNNFDVFVAVMISDHSGTPFESTDPDSITGGHWVYGPSRTSSKYPQIGSFVGTSLAYPSLNLSSLTSKVKYLGFAKTSGADSYNMTEIWVDFETNQVYGNIKFLGYRDKDLSQYPVEIIDLRSTNFSSADDGFFIGRVGGKDYGGNLLGGKGFWGGIFVGERNEIPEKISGTFSFSNQFQQEQVLHHGWFVGYAQ